MMRRICASLFAAAALLSMGGCLSIKSYVDPTLGDVKPEQRAAATEKRPVQLIFNFETDGAANSRATTELTKEVTDLVVQSGRFSQVSTTPVEGGAILAITINNVPEKNAAGKGFGTGLTLGLAGSKVSDFYIATAKYSRGGGAPVTKEARHALHSTIGATTAPEGLTPAKDLRSGLSTVVRQLMDHVINDLAKDPAFAGAPAVASLTITIDAAA
ncbi:MAG TPA: hypothetical protein VFV70_14415 [Hyphomonadaceae bacterium]|nr:hypothetical protein [Hyphomonadaceae bacterium]